MPETYPRPSTTQYTDDKYKGDRMPGSINAKRLTTERLCNAPAPFVRQGIATSDFFTQRLAVDTGLRGIDRATVFRALCEGRRVLHVGCADWPITDVNANLHVQLDSACETLDGLDINTEAFDTLRPHLRGELFSGFGQVHRAYDVTLVPEVIEHIPNVELFLSDLDSIDCRTYVITAPDAYQCRSTHFSYDEETSTFTELVHPDHNYWYTPYTLKNVIEKYTPWTFQGMWYFNNISLLSIWSR